MSHINGRDPYGSTRRVTVESTDAHVAITVQCANGGLDEALLTPAQARAVAEALNAEASLADIVSMDDQP